MQLHACVIILFVLMSFCLNDDTSGLNVAQSSTMSPRYLYSVTMGKPLIAFSFLGGVLLSGLIGSMPDFSLFVCMPFYAAHSSTMLRLL